jgi:hypothetical protein
VLSAPVIDKLGYVHHVVRESRVGRLLDAAD